jgi:Mg-chelatase subunit ChlD
VRVGLVAYRDERDEFETKAWEFNSDIAKVRQQLWSLSADGGGDAPEAVYPAMKLACTQLSWRTAAEKVLVIVGDAPPHVGYGGMCVNLAQRGRDEAKLTTHCIQAKGKDVKHFPEIAKAGGGRCVSLKDNDLLMAEITGLSLGDRYQDEFQEFFENYLELCR